MKIKAVIMSHNTPNTTKDLYDLFVDVFDVTVFDVDSSEGKSPECPSERYPNLYYTGCWREAMRRFGDYDVLWVIGGDVKAENLGCEYRIAMETIGEFGLWSPSFSGYHRDIMSKQRANDRVLNVYHLEGISMAMSQNMMRSINWDIPKGSVLGWGVDLWMSWMGWNNDKKNVLDGRVSMWHPEGCGYSREKARSEMDGFMENSVGKNWFEEARISPEFGLFENNIRGELNG